MNTTAKELHDTRQRLGEVTPRLRQLQRWRFGRRSEKVPQQQLLFAFVRAFAAPERAPTASEPPPKTERKARPHGRRVVAEDLPKRQVVQDLSEDETKCGKGGRELVRIGPEVSRPLDVKPPQLEVLETIRPKYACGCEGHGVAIADRDPPLPRCLAAPGLLAYVCVHKFQFHLPLFRQSKMFESLGVNLPDSTLGGWVAKTAPRLEPVHTAMKKHILPSDLINTDDSPVPVLDRALDRTRQARLWTQLGDASHPHIVYESPPTLSTNGRKSFWPATRGIFKRRRGRATTRSSLGLPDRPRSPAGLTFDDRGTRRS